MRRLIAAALLALPFAAAAGDGPLPVAVVKAEGCGCCDAWAERLAAEGFAPRVVAVAPDALERLKAARGVPEPLRSCHTAEIEGYVIEGHVPAEDIRRLLAERPDAVGLAVPGMPAGSPGMETGGPAEPFEVVLIRRDGGSEPFARHPAP